MYCTNCGRKLPEDGSPCICGAQNGNFNTQPPQYFQAPPQYYAQPPVRPVTPVHGMLKRFASSKLFFMCALLFTVQMVVSAVSSVIEVFTVLQNQAYLLERTPVGTNFNVEFNVNIMPVQNILVLIGLWLLYASAKKTDTPFMSTAGVTLFKVTEILQIVGCGIFCGMLLLIGLLVLLASSGCPERDKLHRLAGQYRYFDSGYCFCGRFGVECPVAFVQHQNARRVDEPAARDTGGRAAEKAAGIRARFAGIFDFL